MHILKEIGDVLTRHITFTLRVCEKVKNVITKYKVKIFDQYWKVYKCKN